MASGGRSAGPTIAEVARAAGVSTATVSNALNSPHRLLPATLAHVQSVIDDLGYQRNRAARSLRTQASRQIGYCIGPDVPHTAGGLMDRFLHAMAEASQAEGYFLLIFTAQDGAGELANYSDMLRAGAVDGFVIPGIDKDDQRVRWLLRRKVPFVTFGRAVCKGQYWVDVDGAAGTESAVDHLVERGHRRIAFLGWPEGSAPGDQRALGWRRGMDRHGLDCTRGAAIESIDDAARSALRLLDAAVAPTAIVAASDTLALGCVVAARQRGLEVGVDLAVVGFDDSVAAELHTPSLTSVRQPLEEVGQEIIRLLDARLSGRTTEQAGVLLSPKLVIRESSSAGVGRPTPPITTAGTTAGTTAAPVSGPAPAVRSSERRPARSAAPLRGDR